MKAIVVIENEGELLDFSALAKAFDTHHVSVSKGEVAGDSALFEMMMRFLRDFDPGPRFESNHESATLPSPLPTAHVDDGTSAFNQNDTILAIGPIVMNISSHKVTVAGKEVRLTTLEFKLLACLAERLGRVQSRDQLMAHVWPHNCCESTRTIDGHIARLRIKLGKACNLIQTIRGSGYKVDLLEN